jgi:hypothetical protein
MWKGLEEQAREALGRAAQSVGDVEAAEAEASTMRVQADIAERCNNHLVFQRTSLVILLSISAKLSPQTSFSSSTALRSSFVLE